MSNPFAAIQKFFTRPSYSQVIQANLALQGRVSALLEWRKELEERCNRFFLEARAAEVEVERLRALVPLEPAAAIGAFCPPAEDTFQDDMEKASVPPPRRRRLGILRKTTKTPKGKK